ncbi:MAG: hypothetical protein MUF73_12860 [Rhodobacteraceae bacterium]|jgi:hypothetical protein|nr:hypothetical protein [Paracoccaceae bacterium]
MPLRLICVLVALCAGPGLLWADPLTVPSVTGPEEVIFDGATAPCEPWDIPDTPARAWRSADGTLRVVAGSERSRALAGPALDRMTRDCAVLHEGARDPDPAAWNDRTWIAAVHPDGPGRLVALGHVEYHGHLDPARCPSGRYLDCWFNGIVELRSDDGGRSFVRQGGGADLVAALPYPWPGETGARMGYFNPSNILEQDGFLYAFVFAESFGAQARGPCLLRRPVGGAAADWRAWDGMDFGVRFVDPYGDPPEDPARHVCTPVRGIGTTISTVLRHGPTGRFIALTPAARPGTTPGIWWSVSDTLTDWSAPRLLHAVPLLWRRDCAAPAAYAYPGMIDTDDPGAMLDTIAGAAWLTLTRMPLNGDCQVTAARDLVRLAVHWPDVLPP